MGIVFEVKSIFASSTVKGRGLDIQDAIWKEYIQLICESLNWETLPWNDRIDYIDENATSANYSKYNLVLMLADGTFAPTHNKSISPPFVELSKEKRFEQFRNFLDRDEYTNFYLPIDFYPPRHLENKLYDTTFVIGSSIRLANEMQELQKEILFYQKCFGSNAQVRPGEVRTWEDLHDFCTKLHAACIKSIQVKLPVQLMY